MYKEAITLGTEQLQTTASFWGGPRLQLISMFTATQTPLRGELDTSNFRMEWGNTLPQITTTTELDNSVTLVLVLHAIQEATTHKYTVYLPVKCQTVEALLLKPASGYMLQCPVSSSLFINPRRACAVRVTVVGYVSVSVCYSTSHLSNACSCTLLRNLAG